MNCDATSNVIDALFIVQLEVGLRNPTPTCPFEEPATQILAGAGDVNRDSATNVIDALLIAQCEVGIPNTSCPLSPINALEVEWASARQAVIEEIVANGWGRDGSTIVGPGGMSIDLTGCPADWDDLAGVRDGEIVIGTTAILTGPYARFGDRYRGMQMYFDYANERGGIGPLGLQTSVEVVDDAGTSEEFLADTDEMLTRADPFMFATLGVASSLWSHNLLNAECIPHPTMAEDSPRYGDPAGHPFTTISRMSASTEARLWVEWIEQNFDPGTTVGALVVTFSNGLAYESSFAQFADASATIESVNFVRHDAADLDVDMEIEIIAGMNPDVLILMTVGDWCLSALNASVDPDLAPIVDAKIMSASCTSVPQVMAPAGDAGDGWLAISDGIRSTTNVADADDPFVMWTVGEIAARGGDPNNEFFGDGFGYDGWIHIEALRIAAELPGGLTRSNFLVAMRSLELNHPMLVDGVPFSVNGNVDPWPVEGSHVLEYDSAAAAWSRQELQEINGQTPPCAWVFPLGCPPP